VGFVPGERRLDGPAPLFEFGQDLSLAATAWMRTHANACISRSFAAIPLPQAVYGAKYPEISSTRCVGLDAKALMIPF
jgi:hypothetical protein